MTPDGLLTNLNASQHAAVSSFADTLAILAGPGSGKTHTLTSRTAWLLAQGLQPWNIIVATFTVKAAREMKERIGKLLGNGLESKLVLGTFHSIARRYLARYGHLIDIRKDFGIADTSDSLAILKRIVKRRSYTIDPKVARNRISGIKARTGGEVQAVVSKAPQKTIETREFEACYAEYEESLKRSNLLDYDDLLLRCVDLLRQHPSCVSNVEAVLIDEFQDTNLVQFDLMRLFASHRKRITIVGDPDQSIYGFRAAETKNYKRMIHQYPDTVTIALEENYRSSGAILFAALTLIEQDNARVAKTLMPTHTIGTRPVLRKITNAHQEAEWIITEIQRCRGLMGDLLDLNDFSILLRSSALSRLIESALGKAGIAYRMVGGLRFYDRLEVKTILDYVRVVNQPDNNDAIARVINTPSRRIGEATIKSLLEEADQLKITLWNLILGTVQGKRAAKTKLPTQTEKGVKAFVDIILTARSKMLDPKHPFGPVELIQYVLKRTNYEQWLEEHHGDVAKGRWANVEELITQASDFQDLIADGYEEESLPEVEGLHQDNQSDPLSRFLANVALASEVKGVEVEGMATPRVTISTIHAAKGLEWPVVFIPAAYQGSIPHSRAEDDCEERRLLYVAMTRAKSLLYMSYPLKNSQGEQTTLSHFLSPVSFTPLLDDKGPQFSSSSIHCISQILQRALPSSESIAKSSQFLKSREDDLFPINGEDSKVNADARWFSKTGNPTFTRGQQPPTRRYAELGRSNSNMEDHSAGRESTYITTMDRAASFTTTSMTLNSTFVSARSLPPLNEQPGHGDVDKDKLNDAKLSAKQKKNIADGQGTLMGFLGKVEPQQPQPSKRPSTQPIDDPRDVKKPYITNLHLPRSAKPITPYGISPELGNHRPSTKPIVRPQQPRIPVEKHMPYAFLSSSPMREKFEPDPEPELEKPAPIPRPAPSNHMTTVNTVQQGLASKRTLGMKRSMNGWGSRKGQGFVPPTMKRPG